MAKDLFRTPLAPVRWAHLITPRHQLDRSKPLAWTCDLLLPNADEKAQAFLLAMEDQFIALHGSRKRRAEKGFPWKADKDKPSELTVVRFKIPQFQRRDGSLSEGPPHRRRQEAALGWGRHRQRLEGDRRLRHLRLGRRERLRHDLPAQGRPGGRVRALRAGRSHRRLRRARRLLRGQHIHRLRLQ